MALFSETEDNQERMDADVEDILRRQDEAMALLERLRRAEPNFRAKGKMVGGGRRDFRRWPIPDGVTVERYDNRWQVLDCLDIGMGGVRVDNLPVDLEGPMPLRLRAPEAGSFLVLSDIMWRGDAAETNNDLLQAGLRFEFQDEEERDLWAGALIDALLARQALN